MARAFCEFGARLDTRAVLGVAGRGVAGLGAGARMGGRGVADVGVVALRRGRCRSARPALAGRGGPRRARRARGVAGFGAVARAAGLRVADRGGMAGRRGGGGMGAAATARESATLFSPGVTRVGKTQRRAAQRATSRCSRPVRGCGRYHDLGMRNALLARRDTGRESATADKGALSATGPPPSGSPAG